MVIILNEDQHNRIFSDLSEYLKTYEPEEILSEAKWYNLIGDVVGIFDPTGAVDFINGISYISQGDYFFGFLSMVAVIPYVGDAIAKPIMGVAKSGKLMKGIDTSMKMVKNGEKLEDAAKVLQNASKGNPLIKKLIEYSPRWGQKLKDILMKLYNSDNKFLKNKLSRGLVKTIFDWIDLFIKASKTSRVSKQIVGNFAKNMKRANPKDAQKIVKELAKMKKQISKEGKIFKNFKYNDASWMSRHFWGGFAIPFLKNGDLAALTRKTRFYAGFLDYLGLGNFVGPEELTEMIPEDDLKNKFLDYTKTEEGINYWNEDMGQDLGLGDIVADKSFGGNLGRLISTIA